MIGLLIIVPLIAVIFLYIAGIFAIRYFIGEKTFWGRKYLKQGYRILRSQRLDIYFLDTIIIGSVFMLYYYNKSFLSCIETIIQSKLTICFVLVFLWSLPIRKTCVFYDEKGLLLIKPFQDSCFVPWAEVGSIQKQRYPARFYIVFDKNGHQLTPFSLNKKTRQFIHLAQQNDISQKTAKYGKRNREKKILKV